MTRDKAPEWAYEDAKTYLSMALDYEPSYWDIERLARDYIVPAYERGQADSRTSFIEWLRPWVKRRFGKWITHNTATGAFNEYQAAIRSLPIEQEGGE